MAGYRYSLAHKTAFLLVVIAVFTVLLASLQAGSGMARATGNESGAVLRPAPANPVYVTYQVQHDRNLLLSDSCTLPGRGLIPSPVDLSHLKGKSICWPSAAGGIPSSYLSAEAVELTGYQAAPAQYDLRSLDRVTDVRDQGASGSCWAFAALGSLESGLMPDERLDFSENNLKNAHGFDGGPDDGGNHYMATAYLARWSGPVSEADDPFDPVSTWSPAMPPQKHVQDVLYIPSRANVTDNDGLKQAIMTYGAVYTGINADDLGSYDGSPYYIPGDTPDRANHAVALAGWDDNATGDGLPGAGAFIAKNSWGADWGDDGYFYVSYYEGSFGEDNAVFTAEQLDNYRSIYQHDWLGWTSDLGYGSDVAWFAAAYTAISGEELSAVGFYEAEVNADYQLYVYVDGVLAGSQSGTIAVPGYHTIGLEDDIPVRAGQRFMIQVRHHTPGYEFPIPVEAPFYGYSSGALANASESFASADGVTWDDVTDAFANTDVCLKAYTREAIVITPASILVSRDGSDNLTADYSISLRSQPATDVIITAVPDSNVSVSPASVTFTPDDWSAPGNFTVSAENAMRNATVAIAHTISGGDPFYDGVQAPSVNAQVTVYHPVPYVQFGRMSYAAGVNPGNVTVGVSLDLATNSIVSIGYNVSGGTAIQGTDFTGGAGNLSIGPGDLSATFNITVLEGANESGRTIVVMLSGPVNATIGGNASATIYLQKDIPPTLESFTIAVHSGWNLVSLPLTPVNGSIAALIPPGAVDKVRIVWHYDNSNPDAPVWKFYKPGRAVNTLANVTDGMGFWILATGDFNITVNGTAPSGGSEPLNRGWNMVGLRGLSTGAPEGEYGSYYLTWGYENGHWYYYKPSRVTNTLTEIKPGSGYWVLVR